MTQIVSFLVNHRIAVVRTAVTALIVVLVGIVIHKSNLPPKVIQLDPITKIVEVPVEKLTTKTVTQYVPVQDRAAVAQLMQDNDRLNVQVQQLSASLATATSQGAGPVTVVTPEPTTVRVPITVSFKDWRLAFDSDGKTATYTLNQKFAVLNTMGRNADNTPVTVVRLFEVGANGERIPIPISETTLVTTLPDQAHFYVKPKLQAGIAVLPQMQTTTLGRTIHYDTAGVMALPWLYHGTTTSVETTRYAYLTPVVTLNETEKTGGIAPFSVNLGTIKHVPFTDIWVSPYLGISSLQQKKKFGIVFSSTF